MPARRNIYKILNSGVVSVVRSYAVSAFQTTSKKKPDSFGTADIPISTPIPTATPPWRKSTTGQPKMAKAAKKTTTSTATKSASRVRWPMVKVICCGTANTLLGAVWKRMNASIGTRISRSDFKTSIMMKRLGCTITWCVITSLMRVGLWIRIRLGCWVVITFIGLRRMRRHGWTH